MATLADITLRQDAFTEIRSNVSVPIGTALYVTNKNNVKPVLIYVSDTPPGDAETSGMELLPGESTIIPRDVDGVFIRALRGSSILGVSTSAILTSRMVPGASALEDAFIEIGDTTSLRVSSTSATTAFGELATAQAMPVVQITGQYGIRSDVITPTITSGTATTQDAKFVASTGTDPAGLAAILTAKEIAYKAGQGLSDRFTALFSAGQPNSTQQAGFITSESAFAFGYNGSDFGILHAKGGDLEQQLLTLTTPAAGSESATVTVDGNAYTVNLTSGTLEFNAFEISNSLSSQVPGYVFTSNGATITALAQVPDLGSGAFLFSSSTAAGGWVEIVAGILPVETWVNKVDWNVNPNIVVNPQLGNVYQIQVQYLGFGGIRFFIENEDTATFELVHIIKYANSATVPSVSNPIFRVGWACRNTGNTTDILVQGASASAFIEGHNVVDAESKGICATTTSIGTTSTNILALRNSRTFNGRTSRAAILPIFISMFSDTSKTGFFEVVRNPIVSAADMLSWSYFDQAQSPMEIATDKVTITGGDVVACFSVSGSSIALSLEGLFNSLSPGDSVAVTGRVSGGAAADFDLSFSWKDDL